MVKLEVWFDGPVYYRLPKFGRLEAVGNRRTFEGVKQYSYFTITCDWYIQLMQYERRGCCTVRYYVVKSGEEFYLLIHSSGCDTHPGILDYREMDKEVATRIIQISKREQPARK